MTSADWTPWISATLGAWAVLFYLQLGDLLAERAGLRAVDGRGTSSRRRIPIGAAVRLIFGGSVLFIAAVLVVDVAARLIGENRSPAVGALLLLVVALLLAVVGTASLLALTDDAGSGYIRLLSELGRLEHSRVTKDEVAAVRDRLQAADAERTQPAGAIAWWRFVPAAVGVLAVLALFLGAEPLWWLGLLGLVLPSASIQLAIGTARTRSTRLRSLIADEDVARAELVTAIDLLERRAARGIPGLSDRVSRALQILREQEKK